MDTPPLVTYYLLKSQGTFLQSPYDWLFFNEFFGYRPFACRPTIPTPLVIVFGGLLHRINSKDNTCKTEKPPAYYYPPYVAPQPMMQHPTMPHPRPYPVWPIPPKSSSDCSEEKLWEEYKNDNGRTYYYNKETKEPQWNKPDNLEEKMKKKEPERPEPPKQPKKYSDKNNGMLGSTG